MHCHPFLLAAPKSLYLHGSYAPSKISTFRTPSSSALSKGSDRHPGAPHAGFPSSFWISGLPGWPRPTEQEPFCLLRLLPAAGARHSGSFHSRRRRSGRRRCGGRAGQPRFLATRVASPLHLSPRGSQSSHSRPVVRHRRPRLPSVGLWGAPTPAASGALQAKGALLGPCERRDTEQPTPPSRARVLPKDATRDPLGRHFHM